MTEHSPVNRAGIKILVVDDTATNRQILAAFLKKLGFSVLMAEDGAQAVDKYSKEHPDIILMDVMMPVMDGYEATRRIKALAGERWTPIVFLSALDKEENLVSGLDAGGDDYLNKPVNFVILDAKLRSIVRTLDLQRQLNDNARSLQEYHDAQEVENALAQDIVERQMLRAGLKDPKVQHWLTPADNFSGDIVAATRGPCSALYVLLADATGHGLGAAICTLPVLSVFYSLAESGTPLAHIINEINRQLLATMPVGRFVAVSALRVDSVAGCAEVWIGGTPDVLLLDTQGRLRRSVAASHLPLGVTEFDAAELVPELIDVAAGEQFVLFSDGLLEASNAAGEQFGFGAMAQALASAASTQRVAAIKDSLERHLAGLAPHDDVSLMIIDC
ncbi:MAG: fused response regulator/phosphatase [Rhodocyclaceae bacterium]|jgi:DNA-binding response OmpR family regulator|nr:fused response regulator/phosphatase [Rhodocyclaceae bacterium]